MRTLRCGDTPHPLKMFYPGWITPCLSLISLFGLLTLARNFGYLQFLELAAYDLLVTTMTRAGGSSDVPITVITINESDIQRLGNWPLKDEQMVEALAKLLAESPSVIGVDIYRDLAVPPGTPKLHALLASKANIIMIEKFPTAQEKGIRPPTVLAGTDRVGFADLAVDSGGVIRRNLLFQTIETDTGDFRTGYSFGLRLALAHLAGLKVYPQPGKANPEWLRLGEVDFMPMEGNEGGYVQTDAGGYQILLEYIGGAKPFKSFHLGDLLDGRIDGSFLRNRIIIIGEDSEGVKDRFNTPHAILGSREIAGSIIHAHAVGQILEAAMYARHIPGTWGYKMELVWLFLWVSLGTFVGWNFISYRQLLVDLVGSIILVIGCAIAFYYGWWIPLIPTMLGWQGAIGLNAALRSGAQRREYEMLKGLFSKHVSPQVAAAIWERRNEVLVNGGIRPQLLIATIILTDFQGFTKISETMAPEPFLNWLNRYLGAMTDVIMAHGGVLDDYAGDGIKANFGVPVASVTDGQIAKDAQQAVACALALGRELNRLNKESKAIGLPGVAMRIGIHTGPVVVGTVGSRQRMKYTTVGSSVNLASRLESLKDEVPGPDASDRRMSCRILMSAATAELLRGYHLVRQGSFQLRSIQHETEVFSIGPWPPER